MTSKKVNIKQKKYDLSSTNLAQTIRQKQRKIFHMKLWHEDKKDKGLSARFDKTQKIYFNIF